MGFKEAGRLRIIIPFIFLVFCSPGAGFTLLGQTRFEVQESTVGEIHDAFQNGKLSAESLVQACLSRIQHYDQRTGLNSIVLCNPHALQRARQLDQQFKRTGKLLPLHGIPVVVKDNYDTHDLPTSAGSSALKHSLPPDDAFQIKRIREAGAIVLCKSNMAEWAFSPEFTESSTAGVTRNPYNLNYVPAGSSGGTAAAVAANFGILGLGTDTGNSIRGPSSHCALVGIRPTLGLTSRDGIVPLILRNDVGGPMCRTVEDAARLLTVIASYDPNDPVTRLIKDADPRDYLDACRRTDLKGKRIGVFRTLSNQKTTDPEILNLFNAAVMELQKAGAEIVDPFNIKNLNLAQLNQAQGKLWVETFDRDVTQYLGQLKNPPIRNLDDIIAFRDYGTFLKSRLAYSRRARVPASLKLPSSANPEDDPNRARLRRQVRMAMDQAKIEVFVFPTWNNPPRKVGDLDSPSGNNSYQIAPHTGQPAITVPMGFHSTGLPAGLQMIGRSFGEFELIEIAQVYERRTQHRRPPKQFGKVGVMPLNWRNDGD